VGINIHLTRESC